VRLREASFGDEVRSGQFLGISVLSEALRTSLPRTRDGAIAAGLIEDALVPALARGETVHSFAFEGPWHDIGTLESYLRANLAWLAERKLEAWVAPSADVSSGVRLQRSLVGEGAQVRGNGSVTGCVVWPGALAVAPLRDRVITS
jgi:mannose-1-phosphate guanylyltransferase